MYLCYNADYCGAEFSFDTTKKAQWIVEDMARHPIPNVTLLSPPSVTSQELSTLHHPDYVHAVETGEPRDFALSQNFKVWGPGLWKAVTASTGGMVAAAFAAMEGKSAGTLSSGLHHARFHTGNAFCTFNGLVLAAQAIHRVQPGINIFIPDWDAHGGGGTYSLALHRRYLWQMDVAVSPVDAYRPSDTRRFSYDLVAKAEEYLPTIERRLEEFARRCHFDLCLYNPFSPWSCHGHLERKV